MALRIPIRHSTFLLAMLTVIMTSVLVSVFALRHMETMLAPKLHQKAFVVAQAIQELVSQVNGYGVPFDRMRGMNEYMQDVLGEHADISYILIADNNAKVVYSAGVIPDAVKGDMREQASGYKHTENTRLIKQHYNTYLPVIVTGQQIAAVHIGQPRKLFNERFQESVYDIITVVVVSILVSFELLIFLVTYTISSPTRNLKQLLSMVSRGDFTRVVSIEARDEVGVFTEAINTAVRRINDAYYDLSERINSLKFRLGDKVVNNAIGSYIDTATRTNKFTPSDCVSPIFSELTVYVRPALFLLVFSESLSLSFFPLYVSEMYEPMSGISKEMVIGLPISLFMMVWAVSLPSAGNWSDRIGRRKAFMTGAVITALGLVFTAFCDSILELLIWRSLTAIGYAIVFITCQGYVTDHTNSSNRSRGMAMFLAGFFSGSLCGAAIGGILSTHVGYSMTFLLSAVMSLLSVLFVNRFIHEHQTDDVRPVVRKARLADYVFLIKNKRFLVLTVFAAIPAKIALTGFLYYTGPIYMQSIGLEQSNIGRIMMAYGLAIIFLSPLIGRLADRMRNRAWLVVGGGLLSSLAIFELYFYNNALGVLISVSLLGIAHAVGVSPQITLMTQISQREASHIGLGTSIGVFRLIERMGSVLGPLIAALLITYYGFQGAFMGMATISLVGMIVFVLSFQLFDWLEKGRGTLEEQRV